MAAFIFGLGFSAAASAHCLGQGDDPVNVLGTVRTPGKADRLTERYQKVLVFDGTRPGLAVGAALQSGISHVIQSIPPDEAGDPVLRHHRADLDAAGELEWLCYYSTIGVYGDFSGGWADESAPLVPRNMRSDRRVLAEAAWRAYAKERGVPLCILRLAGIYGPGRSAFDKLRAGTARRLVKPGQVFNRIHVADIGRVTALAAATRLAGTFNLADDEPAPPQDVVTHAAALLGVAPPPETAFETAELTPMQRSFYRDNKRVANHAIKQALGIELLYPSYRDGLAAIHEEEK